MKPSANTLFIILTAIIIAGLAYWYFRPGADIESTVTPGVTLSAEQVEFQSLVAELEPIEFNTNIFKDAEFRALTDLTTAIAPETPGRDDPFAPVSGVSAQ
jgi:hypothetical protein